MAQRKYEPNSWLLMFDLSGDGTDPADFSLVVCLENWAYPTNRDEIDAKSMCGPDKSVGGANYGPITFDGQVILSPDTGKLGLAALKTAFAAKTKIAWKLAPVTPVTGDVTEAGFGTLSQLDTSAATDEVPKFSAALTIYGTPTTTITA